MIEFDEVDPRTHSVHDISVSIEDAVLDKIDVIA